MYKFVLEDLLSKGGGYGCTALKFETSFSVRCSVRVRVRGLTAVERSPSSVGELGGVV